MTHQKTEIEQENKETVRSQLYHMPLAWAFPRANDPLHEDSRGPAAMAQVRPLWWPALLAGLLEQGQVLSGDMLSEAQWLLITVNLNMSSDHTHTHLFYFCEVGHLFHFSSQRYMT